MRFQTATYLFICAGSTVSFVFSSTGLFPCELYIWTLVCYLGKSDSTAAVCQNHPSPSIVDCGAFMCTWNPLYSPRLTAVLQCHCHSSTAILTVYFVCTEVLYILLPDMIVRLTQVCTYHPVHVIPLTSTFFHPCSEYCTLSSIP